jgi:ATP/maltotriose-dependent transcriptional regulator MalT
LTAPRTVGAPLLERERLMALVRSRFDHRLVAVVAGAGFGKSTLVRQTMSENLSEPRGLDACVECTAEDSHLIHFTGRLGRLFDIDAMPQTDVGAAVSAVVDAISLRSPMDVCLILDDAQYLRGSAAWDVVRRLHDHLPPNGHLLLSTRTDPELPFARLALRGEAVLINEELLSFTPDECTEFGRSRGVDLSKSPVAWPALAELEASGAYPGLQRSYLVQEVVDTLNPQQRLLLGAVLIAEGADDALAGELVQREVSLIHEFGHIPLVHFDDRGWARPHDLWRQALSDLLSAEQRREMQNRAAHILAERGRYTQALRLLRATGSWGAAGRVALLALSVQPPSIETSVLVEILEEIPAAERKHPGWQLAGALVTYERSLAAARPALERLVDQLEVTGVLGPSERADAIVAALFHLGTIARRMGDEALLHTVAERLTPLAMQRHSSALALRADVQSVLAQIHGRCADGLAALDVVDHGSISNELSAHVFMMGGNMHLLDGRSDRAAALYLEASTRGRGTVRVLADELHATALWSGGHLDEAIDAQRRSLDAAERLGLTSRASQFRAMLSAMLVMVGRYDEAGDTFDALPVELGSKSADDETRSLSLLVIAVLALSEGDRDRAIEFAGRITEPDGHLQRAMFLPAATIVALCPERVANWQSIPALLIQRAVALGLCVARGEPPISLDADPLQVRRALALLPSVLLGSQRSNPDALVAALPELLKLSLLGPVELSPLPNPGPWRRARVRELVAAIALTGPRSREQLAELLWPDQAEGVGSRNLRVNLSYLADAVEPERERGGSSSLIAVQGSSLGIAQVGVWLDVTAFDDARRRARAAELNNDPAGALDALTEALGLWRGDVAADLDAEWLEQVRQHRRAQFITMAARAGELALGQGEIDQAVALAERVLKHDATHERAGRLRAACLLASGDRNAAITAIQAVLEACDEIGVEGEPETIVLATRLGAI